MGDLFDSCVTGSGIELAFSCADMLLDSVVGSIFPYLFNDFWGGST